jgi:ribosomal protein L11 methyltransferase
VALYEIKTEIAAECVQVVDELLLEQGWSNWNVTEDVIARRAWVTGIFEEEGEGEKQWNEVSAALAAGGVTMTAATRRSLGDIDWRDSYKEHFKAWQFGRLHWVPVWEREKFSLPPGDAVLWLDPGLAFGTGNHETTRLCVERLVAIATQDGIRSSGVGELESNGDGPNIPNSKLQTPNSKPPRERHVVDAGCGSGILALSAALLGYRDISGFDNDPEAVRISEENAALNGLGGRVRFHVADLVTGLANEAGRVDVLLANIQADVLMRFARELASAVAPGGTLILSGILAGENSEVRTTFEQHAPNWTVNARVMGEWSDVVLTRPD